MTAPPSLHVILSEAKDLSSASAALRAIVAITSDEFLGFADLSVRRCAPQDDRGRASGR
jgi:hypothetical protein